MGQLNDIIDNDMLADDKSLKGAVIKKKIQESQEPKAEIIGSRRTKRHWKKIS
jgi:hypothetical protein